MFDFEVAQFDEPNDAPLTTAYADTPAPEATPATVDSWDQLLSLGEFDWNEGLSEAGATGDGDDAGDSVEEIDDVYDGWTLDENGEWVEVDADIDEWTDVEPVVAAAPSEDAGFAPWWAENTTLGNIDSAALIDDDDDEPDDETLSSYDAGADSDNSYGTFARFNDNADLESPDEFELDGEDWALVDEDADARRDYYRVPDEDDFDYHDSARPIGIGTRISNIVRTSVFGRLSNYHPSKVVTIVTVIAALAVLAVFCKEAFTRVSAAPGEPALQLAASCATGSTVNVKNAGSLESVFVTAPKGWTVQPDNVANTGPIDFAAAIKAEPNARTALAALDQSRFANGYSRSYKSGSVVAHVSIYQFASAACASDYVSFHESDPVKQTFDASVVAPGATGQVTGSDASRQYVLRAAAANRVGVLTWTGDGSQSHATSGVISFATAQIAALLV